MKRGLYLFKKKKMTEEVATKDSVVAGSPTPTHLRHQVSPESVTSVGSGSCIIESAIIAKGL